MLNGGNDEACLARSRLTGLRVTPFMTLSYRRQASALSSLAPNSNSGVLASIILKLKKPLNKLAAFFNSGTTRLELATSCVTGMRSNQTELRSHIQLSFLNTSTYNTLSAPVSSCVYNITC